jgi:hypothetical protein
MLAPLQCSSGSVAAPSLTFSADTDTGLYRIGANNLGTSVGGVKVTDCINTGCTFPLTLSVTGVTATAKGITATQSTSNTAAITATGNGNAAGGTFTGGATGHGVTGTGGGGDAFGGFFVAGATNGDGARGTGTGTGSGLSGIGGATGIGVYGQGGATSGRGGTFIGGATGAEGLLATGTGNSHGVNGAGGGSGNGGNFTGGTTGDGVTGTAGGSVTADTNTRYAFRAVTGHIGLSGGNPTSTTGFSNTVTPMNVAKAWARILPNAGSATTVSSGFNVTNPQEVGNTITIDFTTDFSATPACVVTQVSATADRLLTFSAVTTSTATIQGWDITGVGGINLGGSSITIDVVCYGAN